MLPLTAVMIRGRHRGLPIALDRAVLLPSDLEEVNDFRAPTRTSTEFADGQAPKHQPGPLRRIMSMLPVPGPVPTGHHHRRRRRTSNESQDNPAATGVGVADEPDHEGSSSSTERKDKERAVDDLVETVPKAQ